MRNRCTLVAAAVTLACCSALADEKPPAIANAGFEAVEDGRPANWNWWSRTKHGSAREAGDEKHAGERSACLRHDGPRDWAFSSDTRLPARPGQTFRVAAWVKIDTGELTLAVVALSKGKTLRWDIGSARAGAGGRWARLSAPVYVPTGCDQIHVRFVGSGSTLAWVDDVSLQPRTPPARKPKPKVTGYAFAGKRVRERMDRGLIARPLAGGKVYVGWRLLPEDPKDVAFNVYRQSGEGPPVRLNDRPIRKTTDLVDAAAPAEKPCKYVVRAVAGGREGASGEAATARPGDEPTEYIALRLKGRYTFQKAGIADLDGDGRYDFVIKQPHDNIDPYVKYWKKSPDTYKLEAYRHDGQFLWRHDLGWSIERGIWYSPYVVYDLDGDGKAEVAVKTGEGDPRDAEGKVQSGPEHLTVLDGLTGRRRARTDWPDRKLFSSYNYASRNQLGIAYLDGKTPCLIVERGTYRLIIVEAYEFHGGKLRRLWRWSNKGEPRSYWGQGAHWMHAADVDGDGRDEVILGSAVIDDNGVGLWTTGMGHPDHAYVGDLIPGRPGLEIYYGMETRQRRNGMCMVCAKTGKVLWGHDGPTRHVHSCGMCSDIDAAHPGAECYSADTDARKRAAWARLRSAAGKVLSEKLTWGFGPRTVFWDADPQRELLWKGRVQDYRGKRHDPPVGGRLVAVADVLGDWREEIITSAAGEMRIYTTTIPAADRRPCLMTDPIYRIDVAHAAMGYFQVPVLGYDIAAAAK